MLCFHKYNNCTAQKLQFGAFILEKLKHESPKIYQLKSILFYTVRKKYFCTSKNYLDKKKKSLMALISNF